MGDEKKPDKPAAPKKRAAQDVVAIPTARDIEKSLRRGTSQPLSAFVKNIGW